MTDKEAIMQKIKEHRGHEIEVYRLLDFGEIRCLTCDCIVATNLVISETENRPEFGLGMN